MSTLYTSKHYSIVNPTTRRTLVSCNTASQIQYYWNHIPRRKNSELIMLNNNTGEIVKTKPKKVCK